MSKFLKVIVNLFLVCAILIAGALLVPPLLGVTTVMVDSSSMETNLPIGSVTYSKNVHVEEITVGDKILDKSEDGTYAYVVDAVDEAEGKFLVTDPEGTPGESREMARRSDTQKVLITIPLIGYVLIAMRSVEGLIIIGLIVLFVIILFILSELWKKIDDDDEEEYEAGALETESTDSVEETPTIVTSMETPQSVYNEPLAELTTDELARAVAEVQESEAEHEQRGTAVSDAGFVRAEDVEALESPVKENGLDLSDLEVVEDNDRNSFIPVVRPSKEEILKKAKEAGEKPEVLENNRVGVTIFDYSDLI